LKLGRITGKNHLLRAHSVSTVYSGWKNSRKETTWEN
jgi:hypothetical protein